MNIQEATPIELTQQQSALEAWSWSISREKETRLAVSAVNVPNGNFAYFDNEHDTIAPEPLIASGSGRSNLSRHALGDCGLRKIGRVVRHAERHY